jgi:RNase P/RNase MRP subunit POP5
VGYTIVLRRRDKRRYLLVYADEQIFIGPSQLMDGSSNPVYDNINSQIKFRENMSSNYQEKYNNNNNILHKKNKKYNNNNPHSSKLIKKRFSELFGSIEFEKANITLIYKQNFSLKNSFIIKCNLKSIDKVLFALSCCNPPLTTIKISGTLKKLISSIEI